MLRFLRGLIKMVAKYTVFTFRIIAPTPVIFYAVAVLALRAHSLTI